MPKPAGPDGYIAFGRHPAGTMAMAGSGFLALGVTRHAGPAICADRIESSPARIACNPLFVTYPTDIGSSIAENDGIGLEAADQIPSLWPMIVSLFIDQAFFTRAAIISVAAIGAVVPDLKDRPVASQQLR